MAQFRVLHQRVVLASKFEMNFRDVLVFCSLGRSSFDFSSLAVIFGITLGHDVYSKQRERDLSCLSQPPTR